MQTADLRNKSCKHFLVKNESGAARKKKDFEFFFELIFFLSSSKSFFLVTFPLLFMTKNCL